MQHGRVRLLSNEPKVFPELSFLLCGTMNLRWETSHHNEPASSYFFKFFYWVKCHGNGGIWRNPLQYEYLIPQMLQSFA